MTTVGLANGVANHVGKAVRVKNMGGRNEAPSPYNGIHRYLADVLFLHPSGEVSRIDVSISERVSLGVSSSAKSVAHAV